MKNLKQVICKSKLIKPQSVMSSIVVKNFSFRSTNQLKNKLSISEAIKVLEQRITGINQVNDLKE